MLFSINHTELTAFNDDFFSAIKKDRQQAILILKVVHLYFIVHPLYLANHLRSNAFDLVL